MISRDTIDKVYETAKVEEVISDFVSLKKLLFIYSLFISEEIHISLINFVLLDSRIKFYLSTGY